MTKALHDPKSIDNVASELFAASKRCKKAAETMRERQIPQLQLNYEKARINCVILAGQWVSHVEQVLDEMALAARASQTASQILPIPKRKPAAK